MTGQVREGMIGHYNNNHSATNIQVIRPERETTGLCQVTSPTEAEPHMISGSREVVTLFRLSSNQSAALKYGEICKTI